MSRQNLALTGVGFLVVATLGFLIWAALRPLTTPVAESTPPPTDGVPKPASSATPAVGGVIATTLFTLTLPQGWQWTAQAWPDAKVAPTSQLAELVTAWPTDEDFAQSPTRFSIAAMPRNALSLEQYLVDVTAQFSATTGVSNVDAGLVTDLRQDGLPAALVIYDIQTPAGAFTGLQAATFDASGTQLLIATLTHEAGAAGGERLFRDLVGSLHVMKPAN